MASNDSDDHFLSDCLPFHKRIYSHVLFPFFKEVTSEQGEPADGTKWNFGERVAVPVVLAHGNLNKKKERAASAHGHSINTGVPME